MPRCWRLNTCNGRGSLCIVDVVCVLCKYMFGAMLILLKLYELSAWLKNTLRNRCFVKIAIPVIGISFPLTQ